MALTVTLTLTSARALTVLADQPRHMHHAGVWFADPSGSLTHCLSYDQWTELGEPSEITLTVDAP